VPIADHPSGDQRFKLLDITMKRHQNQPDALIEVLHEAQGLFGYLAPDVLLYVAHGLKLPPSKVQGVATFYHLFNFHPEGKHACVVCMGTACFVSGADRLLAQAERLMHLQPGETTADGKVSLRTARCIGACGLAPAVVYDGVAAAGQTPETVAQHLQEW
jgi:bidirectional [NiFe] hydrogenase diaphorase subunit